MRKQLLISSFPPLLTGSYWSPLTLDEKTWGSSIRSLLKWNGQPSFKYRGHSLNPNVAVAIATASDQSFLFTVCLNHTLKIWNISSNRLVATKDLLDRDLRPQDTALYSLNPSESAFIRVFNADRAMDGGQRYYVVTYSPYEDGRFKFWAVKGALTSDLIVEDLFPSAVLKPFDPDPSGSVFWNVADFELKSVEEGKRMVLWVLWRNKDVYQLYSLHFAFQSLVSDWSSNWVLTALETRHDVPPPAMVPSDVVDVTDKWLHFLFHPGRFSAEVLETALVIFQEASQPLSSPSISKRTVPLQERLCLAITAAISLRKYAEEDMDFAHYRTDIDTKWRAFWQIAADVNKRKFEPVSLSYDSYYDLPWLLLSGSCVVVRECSSTELLLHNTRSELHKDMSVITDRLRHRDLDPEANNLFEQASFLVKVASSFRMAFPAELSSTSRTAVEAEIFAEPLLSIRDRINGFQDRCNFAELISDKDFDDLVEALSERMNVYSLPGEVFYTAIEAVPLAFLGKDSNLLSTHFGVKAMVNGAEEMISLTRQMLLDLLLLAVFLDEEVDRDEGSNFDVEDLFSTLIEMLREYEVMLWLCSHERVRPSNSSSVGDPSPFAVGHSGSKKEERSVTVFEELFATAAKPRSTVNMPQSYALTLGMRDALSLVTRKGESALPNALASIQCDFLAKGNVDLACDFLKFQASTAWATYVKGRLYVGISEHDTAAIYFRKAAYLLSCGKPVGNLQEMSSNLLDIGSVDCFYNGLAKYCRHILSVFEEAGSFSHVAEFASLALLVLERERRGREEYTDLRSELLSHLFSASLTTCRFDEAYSAMSRYTDRALRKSALSLLVTTVAGMGKTGLDTLLRFPTSLDPNLALCVDETLASLCDKQTTFTTLVDEELADNGRHYYAGIDNSRDSPDYSRILQAYRIGQNDYRGAAEVAYRSIQRLRRARDNPSSSAYRFFKRRKVVNGDGIPPSTVDEDEPESKELRYELVALINLLACVDKTQAYILVETDDDAASSADGGAVVTGEGDITMNDAVPNDIDSSPFGLLSSQPNTTTHQQRPRRRVIITLEHLRREYQGELDRVSRIERGDWEFGFGDDDDGDVLEGDGDETMVLS